MRAHGEDTRREHAETGMLRGPFLRIRTPFHKAEAGWEKHLEWVPGSPRIGIGRRRTSG